MEYLIIQMWLCLLVAALLGAIIGYWLAKYTYRTKLNELETKWRHKLDQQKTEYLPEIEKEAKPVIVDTTTDIISKAEQTSYEIEEVEGIGKNYGKKLRDIGLTTTQQLLDKCCTMDGRIEVANHIGIEDFVIHKWASMSDLMRVKVSKVNSLNSWFMLVLIQHKI